MMYPYAKFLLEFDRKHASFTHANRSSNKLAAVIVETRPEFFLPKVLKNTMYFLGPEWNLYILCSELNQQYLMRELSDWDVRMMTISNAARLRQGAYTSMLTSNDFWNLVPAEKLLIFQSDCILCGHNVVDFLKYDYIGAPCVRFDEGFIMNGGLSLRTRAKMLECLKTPPAANEPEDIFFTNALRAMPSAVLPDLETACRFAVESAYCGHPFGVHGTDKCYHSAEIADEIVRAIKS
jgi:hypothetical protein